MFHVKHSTASFFYDTIGITEMSGLKERSSYMLNINLTFVYWYLFLLNILTFALFGLEKRFQDGGSSRIPEWVLLLLAVLGGSMGAFFAIYIFTYKKDQPKFKYGILALYAIQFAICVRLGIF